ncbi:MAG: NACHT domain-containing protein [Candidatus Marithrix sp.]
MDEIEEFLLEDNEVKFLEKMIEDGRIGFKDGENLRYEETFASWKPVSSFKEQDTDIDEDELELVEKELKPIDELMQQYFATGNNLKQVLFVIADFGKGKSVFLRHHAAQLAKKYLQTGEGKFPVYFNLREYKKYSSEVQFGVISHYLAIEFLIDVNTDNFRQKNCIFLIDSLYESGELNKANINAVIALIRNIQLLDPIKCKNNQIVITSRPFDDGLEELLRNYDPYLIKDKNNRKIPQLLSIFGFKKSQFNGWLTSNLTI